MVGNLLVSLELLRRTVRTGSETIKWTTISIDKVVG